MDVGARYEAIPFTSASDRRLGPIGFAGAELSECKLRLHDARLRTGHRVNCPCSTRASPPTGKGCDRVHRLTIHAESYTNATIMTSKVFPESKVLAPRDPSITNSDEWPEFRLSDATVTLPGSSLKAPVSLLFASEHYPLKVTGKLEAVPKESSHLFLLPGKQWTAPIEITNVKSYAYGSYADGSVEIWAAGSAGWYVVSPSRSYQPIYNEMIEAVNLYYFIIDAYQTQRRVGKGRNMVILPEYTAKELFETYAAELDRDDFGPDDSAERIHKHRDFLISSMLSGKDGMAWSGNPLYKHLYKKFPKDFAKIRQRLAPPPEEAKKPEPVTEVKKRDPATTHVRQPSLDSVSTISSLKRKRGRPPKNPVAAADVISIGSSSVTSSVSKDESAKPVAKPVEALKTRTTAQPARRRGRHAKPPSSESETEAPEVHESQPDTTEQESDTDSMLRRPRQGKSALRLKPNKPSKGPPRSSKASLKEEDEDQPVPSSPAPVGKRKLGDPHAGGTRRPKRRSSRHEVDEGIDMPTSPSSEEVADSLASDAVPGATDTDLPLRLNHQLDPIQEDTWICALDGCTHKVYAASLPESQKVIREHYALHAYDDDERVQLVKKLQAPSLPVNHLMEKVRMQARFEGFPGSKVAGTRYPEPLKQRY